ncbi:MAG: DNA translocase FtsK [Ruminococcaceae bacterium]|nr:DNA translocase FtsK [Oscillospiraceae bacterium]
MSESNQNKALSKKKVTVEEQPGKVSKAAKAAGKSGAKAAPAAEAPRPMIRPLLKVSPRYPLRYIFAGICALLLLIFLCVYFADDGVILQWFVGVFCGLFGRHVYLASIPGLMYLIWIQLSSRNKKVRKRSFCVMTTVLLIGCIAHLIARPVLDQTGFELLKQLYSTGAAGMSGGVICGGITELLVGGFGRFFTMSLMAVTVVLCVFWALKLSVLELYRVARDRIQALIAQRKAVQEPEYVDLDVDEEEELGFFTKMVDGFARKRQARREQKLLENGEDAPKERSLLDRTRDMVRQLAPEYEPRLDAQEPLEPIPAEPVPVLPTEPEVAAEVAADPGVPVVVPQKEKVTARDAALSAALVEQEIAAAQNVEQPKYCFPPIDLLKLPRGRAADGTAEMRENTRRLNETLASFKIEAHISNVTRGPSVTRYEVELEKGVRLNKLTSCADDIALSLGASGVRIAPVPGKISVVGIEVPNQTVTNVSLREVIDSHEFNAAQSHSSIAVGKDIGGKCIIGNIAKFPHMLIAGTTGSGKSVCMNSIIISLLYKASPEDVKLIMVDPKMVELGIYNGIPHLLIPVVTDPKKAAGSLQWAVTEMMRRYRSMSDAGVRDLESYNSMIDGGEIEGEHLPQVVVIIDELADLMLVAAKEVEESICRIAQMGRAAGIHLIIATQRPSADVITGLMKANIPSRIAFAVASAMESRIILDTQGAEKLVGKGDMLYSPIGSGKPQRVQGCFVTDTEVEAVANYVKEHFSSTYDQAVMDDIERKAEQTGSKGAPATASDPDPSSDELAHDEMLPDAVDVILETKQASVSLLQRRLKLGYARAARIVDEMEELGIVGPFVGSKPRQILITKEQWEQMKQGQTIVTQSAPPVPEEIDIPF